jgi:hypothetical protein
MAVTPHSSTQKWICSSALRVSVIGIGILCGKPRREGCLPRDPLHGRGILRR